MRISLEGKIGIGLTLLFAISGAVLVIWPSAHMVAWIVLVASALGLLALAIHHFSDQIGAFNLSSARLDAGRQPLLTLRSAAKRKGWNLDGYTPAGRDEGYTFLKKLQQSALDGDLKFSGRPYRKDGLSYGSEPIVEIPAEHFQDHLVEIASFLTSPSNDRTQTTRMGKMRFELKGEIYDDLHIDGISARRWIAKNRKR